MTFGNAAVICDATDSVRVDIEVESGGSRRRYIVVNLADLSIISPGFEADSLIWVEELVKELTAARDALRMGRPRG